MVLVPSPRRIKANEPSAAVVPLEIGTAIVYRECAASTGTHSEPLIKRIVPELASQGAAKALMYDAAALYGSNCLVGTKSLMLLPDANSG
jgi:hypothetical protein